MRKRLTNTDRVVKMITKAGTPLNLSEMAEIISGKYDWCNAMDIKGKMITHAYSKRSAIGGVLSNTINNMRKYNKIRVIRVDGENDRFELVDVNNISEVEKIMRPGQNNEILKIWAGFASKINLITKMPSLFTVDHIIPKHHGGADLHQNLQILTKKANSTYCNTPKRGMSLDAQIQVIWGAIELFCNQGIITSFGEQERVEVEEVIVSLKSVWY